MSNAGIGLPLGATSMTDIGRQSAGFDRALVNGDQITTIDGPDVNPTRDESFLSMQAGLTDAGGNPLIDALLSVAQRMFLATPDFAGLSLEPTLVAQGVPAELAASAQLLWQQAWLGGGQFTGGAVWERWGFGSAAEFISLLARHGIDPGRVQNLLRPMAPTAKRGDALNAPEMVALGLMQPDGRLGGLGAGGLVRLPFDAPLPGGTHGLVVYRRVDGLIEQLAVLTPRERLAPVGAQGFLSQVHRVGQTPFFELSWGPGLDATMLGPLGNLIANHVRTEIAPESLSAGVLNSDANMSPSNISTNALNLSALLSGNIVLPSAMPLAGAGGPDHGSERGLNLILRPRYGDTVPDLLTAALGSHLVFTMERDLMVDLGQRTILIKGGNTRTILVSIDDIGLDGALARIHSLAEELETTSDPVSLLNRGEGLRERHGAPLWLRSLGIDKPSPPGPIPISTDLPRYELVHAQTGGWLIGHRSNGHAQGWRTSYPETARDGAMFWLDLYFALPGSMARVDPAELGRFNRARAHAETALRYLDGLGGVRVAEAWSAVALDVGLAIADQSCPMPDIVKELLSENPECMASTFFQSDEIRAQGKALIDNIGGGTSVTLSRNDALAIALAQNFLLPPSIKTHNQRREELI